MNQSLGFEATILYLNPNARASSWLSSLSRARSFFPSFFSLFLPFARTYRFRLTLGTHAHYTNTRHTAMFGSSSSSPLASARAHQYQLGGDKFSFQESLFGRDFVAPPRPDGVPFKRLCECSAPFQHARHYSHFQWEGPFAPVARSFGCRRAPARGPFTRRSHLVSTLATPTDSTLTSPYFPIIFGAIYFVTAKYLSAKQNGKNRLQGSKIADWAVLAHNVFLAAYSAWT